jgi:TRAP-type C4-dicarboxylate transport system permease small subunit
MATDVQSNSSPLVERLSEFVERITILPCIILGGAMVTVVAIGVTARYVMQNPISWSEEVARFFMNWMALLGVSIALRRHSHLRLLYFVSKTPIIVQRIAKLLSDCLILVFLFFLSIYGIKMVIAAEMQIEPTTGIPMNYPLLCVPICGVLAVIQVIFQIIIDLLSWRRSAPVLGLK